MVRVHVTDDDNKTIDCFDVVTDVTAIWGHTLQGSLPRLVHAVSIALSRQMKEMRDGTH